MIIPANLAVGALVGAAATYVYKNEAAKETLSGLGTKVKSGVDSTLGLFKKKPEADVEVTAEQDVAEVVAADVEVATEEKSNKA